MDSSDEEETTIARRISNDSGIGSENSSRRPSNEPYRPPIVQPPIIPPNRPAAANNEWGGAEIAAGVVGLAGIAFGAFAIGKMLFGSNEPTASGSRMPRITEDEEEVPVRRFNHDYFNPSYLSRISKEIKKDTEEYPVVGLDCQWTQLWRGNARNPIALLQISSHKGKVALIRLCHGQRVPQELLSILANKNIIKSGIETIKDAQYLLNDHSITVQGTYDLRFLSEATGYPPASLTKLSKQILNIDLERNFDLISSDWDAIKLSKDQIEYAQKAAKCSVDIFKVLISKVLWWPSSGDILNYCKDKLDKNYVFYSQNY